MSEFIASRIIKKAKVSTDAGIKQYKAYFVNTHMWEDWRAGTDAILRAEGYEDVIVAA